MKQKTIVALTGVILGTGVANAATVFNNNDGANSHITTAGNWSNGAPGTGNNGTISIDSTSDSGNFGTGWGTASITFDGGTHTARKFQENNGSATIVFDGGSLTSTTGLAANGSLMQLKSDLSSLSCATFGVANGGIWELTAGSITSTGAINFNSAGDGINNGKVSSLGGSAMVTGVSTAGIGSLDIATNWTGSFTLSGYSSSNDWETSLVGTGATYGGAAIDAASFANNFSVSANGQTLSVVAVPEPSSTALLGLGSLTLILRRRK